MKRIGLLFSVLIMGMAHAQSPWPSESWSTAVPLTSVMNAAGLLELSGLHWNPESNRLYVVHGDGRLRVLQLNTMTNAFSQIGNKSIAGGPEGITQVDFSANAFYTIDENNYEIRKYTHTANFTTVTESKHWDLLQSPSPMEDTGNTGPEGIVFVPDENLIIAGFISEVTGQPYTSVKGAGGLFFVAHQDGGYVWVFDINPNVTNDFAYVGKYETGREESCDLSFDRSTGLMYILHNTGSNSIEVTDLTLAPVSDTKFTTISEYYLSNPTDGNINIEGFAVMPKCDATVSGSAFLCRDVESNEDDAIRLDAIRWFDPYVADGVCPPLQTEGFAGVSFSIYPNPVADKLTVVSDGNSPKTISVYNMLGQSVATQQSTDIQIDIMASTWPSGTYIIEVKSDEKRVTQKILKN